MAAQPDGVLGGQTPSLDGQVALVTGATGAIGQAICRGLAARGATVAINFRTSATEAESLRLSLGDGGSAWRADVTRRAEVATMVAGVLETHGRLDVIVLNAAVWRGGRIDRIPFRDWDEVTRGATEAAYNMCSEVVPVMRVAGSGRIIFITSAVAIMGYPGDTAYATAKAALGGLVRSLAKELGPSGITVNAVAPGFVPSAMTASVPDRSRDALLRRTALGRSGSPGDVASAVSYLATEAGYVTGHTLVVDGGMSL